MGSTKSTKEVVANNIVWKFLETLSTDGVSFVISIILARLLLPEEYGQVAMVNIFISLANVFVANGLGSSLIQKKRAESIDFSSVFYVNVLLSLVLYAVLFFSAPFVESFYHIQGLSLVLRVLGLRVIVAAVISIQNAYIARKMMFRSTFFVSLIGTVLSGAVGVGMAYAGYGIWALAAQTLLALVINMIALFIVTKWYPRLEFSFVRVKALVSYGWKILASSLIKTGYAQLTNLVIGKKYSAIDLANYNRGQKYPELIAVALDNSVGTVLFPAISKYQDDAERVKSMVRSSIKAGVFLMSPLLFGLAAIAEPMVKLLLTEKWLPCVPFLRIYSLIYALQTVQTANLQAIRAVGRSDIILKLDILKRGVGVLLLIILMNYGVMGVAISPLLVSIFASIVNVIPNKKLIGYTLTQQLKDILPGYLLSGSMAVVVYLLNNWLMKMGMALPVVLAVSITAGGVYYIGLSFLLKNESLIFVLDTIRNMIREKSKRTKQA